MIHHLSFAVTDLKRSAFFYDAAVGKLGYKRVWSHAAAIGYGSVRGEDKFALKRQRKDVVIPGEGFHVAFAAPTRKAVDTFYKAAMRHGGRDNGGYGLHPEYGPDYYAAFVFDPDGYRIEAVISPHAHA